MIIPGVNKESLVLNKYSQNFGSKTHITAKANLAQLSWYNAKSQSFSSWGKEFNAAIIADTK